MGSTIKPPPRSPIPPIFARPLEPIYRAEVARRNRRYDRGEGVESIDRPVISVGNLSVGGTGKTPMVARIVRWLEEQGASACVAMRGYRHGGGSPDTADEPQLLRRLLPETPIIADPRRARALRGFLATPEGARTHAVVLDDGFQHRKLARDRDIVLIDASRSPFADRLLPAGWLREPVASLRRATAVVVTHAELVDEPAFVELVSRIREHHGDVPIAVSRHAWGDLLDQDDRTHGTSRLRGKRVVGVCAIGNPAGFAYALARATDDGQLAQFIALRDHDPYERATVARILDLARAEHADAIVTTEKDWSKLSRAERSAWPCEVLRPRLDVRFDFGEDALREHAVSVLSHDTHRANP